MEGWVSGLNHQFAKLTSWKRLRGFESPFLRKSPVVERLPDFFVF